MPIYEYRCLKCGHQFEQLQKINSDDLVVCPKCKAPKLQRLISHTSFQLKGSGWYATDYKDKKKVDKKTENNGNKEAKKEKPVAPTATTKDTESEIKTDKK